MLTSVRPLTSMSNYEAGCNDTRDRAWEQRLAGATGEQASVQLRVCLPTDLVEDRFLSDKELVTRILSGDRHAMQWFASRFTRLVAGIVREMPIHPQERSDIRQQVFERLWEQDCRRLRMWQARGRGRLASYLTTIIRRTAFDWLRAQRRANRRFAINGLVTTDLARTIEDDNRDNYVANSTLIVDTEMLVISREQGKAIRHTVSEMLRRDSEILRRRYYRGQTCSEIAEAMGMTANSVYVALNRAHKRMRDKLWLRYPGLFDQVEKAGKAH